MPNKKISQFPVVDTLDNNDIFLVNKDDVTSTITTDNLIKYIKSNVSLGVSQLQTVQTARGKKYIDFADIPSGVNKVTLILNGLGTVGGSDDSTPKILLGTSSGFKRTGYKGAVHGYSGSGISTDPVETGYIIRDSGWASNIRADGIYEFQRIIDNTWIVKGSFSDDHAISGGKAGMLNGSAVLDGPLTSIRITTLKETDNFFAGIVNISYELEGSASVVGGGGGGGGLGNATISSYSLVGKTSQKVSIPLTCTRMTIIANGMSLSTAGTPFIRFNSSAGVIYAGSEGAISGDSGATFKFTHWPLMEGFAIRTLSHTGKTVESTTVCSFYRTKNGSGGIYEWTGVFTGGEPNSSRVSNGGGTCSSSNPMNEFEILIGEPKGVMRTNTFDIGSIMVIFE